jgi:hypothetical protein
MCEKCREIDNQIEEHQKQCRSTSDMPTIEHLQAQVRALITKKLDLHSSPAWPRE